MQTTPSFWKVWHDFEVRHGNEDTFREMLRIKRSVQAQFNTQVRTLYDEPAGSKYQFVRNSKYIIANNIIKHCKEISKSLTTKLTV